MFRLLKLGLISLVFFALLITGFSLFIPSRVRISKAINVKADAAAVWKQVDNIRNWAGWNPLLKTTKKTTVQYNDTMQGNWTDIVWNGTRIKTLGGDTLEHKAEWQKGSDKAVDNGWVCMPMGDSLTVQWYMDFHLSWYPWEKFKSLMLEKSYGPSMEEGLSALKNLVQQ